MEGHGIGLRSEKKTYRQGQRSPNLISNTTTLNYGCHVITLDTASEQVLPGISFGKNHPF